MDRDRSPSDLGGDGGGLPATSWAVLGILSFDSELSGYDVKQWAEQSLAFFYWAPSQSQIYTELRRLERVGLATSRVEQTHTAKSRRLYAITDEGRARMREWSKSRPTEAIMLKHGMVLRLWAAHNSDAENLREMLAEYRQESLQTAADVATHAAGGSREPAWRYPVIALEWAERFYRDEAVRIDWLLERLDRAPNEEQSHE